MATTVMEVLAVMISHEAAILGLGMTQEHPIGNNPPPKPNTLSHDWQIANLSILGKSVGLSLFAHLFPSTMGAIRCFEDTSHGTSEFDIHEL
jgi:hypothetical protein